VWVEAGGSLEVLGVLQGTLHFEAGSQGVIIGGVQGSLTVAPDAALAVKAEEPDRTAA
jgi:predicted SnoaL-like aldol condensation-catalyzing enzyme